jgi:hypothetical protein
MIKVEASIPFRRIVERYIKKIVRTLKPKAVIIYGSAAKGSYGAGSDIDILVISENLPKNFLERLKTLYEIDTTNAPIQPIAYTPQEFERMLNKKHLTALEALEYGLIVYDDGYIQEVVKKFNEMRKRELTRTEEGWEIIEDLTESGV